MSAERNFTDQDYELLSAYLDGALTETERAALETRLQNDVGLRQELEALRQTVNLVQTLPPLKAPRNFTLTSSMVRPRATRWLIFPTSTAFSAISAAAATVLILLGMGILLLQNNAAGTPNFGAIPAAVEQQSNSQIAAALTEIPVTSEKTAQRESDETAAAANTVSIPPSTANGAGGAAQPANSPTSPLQPPQVTNAQEPSQITTDGLGYTTDSGTSGGEETGQAAQPPAPADSTLHFAATMAPPSEAPVAPGAANIAAQTGGSVQQEAPQSSAAAEIMSDQAALAVTEAQTATDDLDVFDLFTATVPAVEAYAAVPTDTPSPSPTLTPTLTETTSPTVSPTPTALPTLIPSAKSVQAAPTDVLIWGGLIIGVLLLIVAIITTLIRRRG
ncbi:MAG: hypothetical protein ABI690_03875 [Chloroflexota bacterium]